MSPSTLARGLEPHDRVRWLREQFDPKGKADKEHEAAGSLGYGWIHYGLVRVLRPARVLAIGSRTGFIPACLALALVDNGTGRLDFVDANLDRRLDPSVTGGIGWWGSHTLGELDAVVDFHIERTDAFFPRQDPGPVWGYAHVDGGHSYVTAKFDAEQTAARLSHGGLMALHDATKGNYGVQYVVTELMRDGWMGLRFPTAPGLAILQKP